MYAGTQVRVTDPLAGGASAASFEDPAQPPAAVARIATAQPTAVARRGRTAGRLTRSGPGQGSESVLPEEDVSSVRLQRDLAHVMPEQVRVPVVQIDLHL